MGTGPTVLVIEDDVAISEILTQLLADLGMRASIVAQADDSAPDLVPDLVLTDLVARSSQRPENGLRYLNGLRARYSGVPLILVTAHEWPRAASGLPVDLVVTKPFDLDELSRHIVALAGRPAVSTQPVGSTT